MYPIMTSWFCVTLKLDLVGMWKTIFLSMLRCGAVRSVEVLSFMIPYKRLSIFCMMGANFLFLSVSRTCSQ